MIFLRNDWYVASWSADLAPGALLGRTIVGEPVVILRKQSGEVAALGDRCPHRYAPLHRGKLIGDVLQCGYHGLEFEVTGRCVRNPHGKLPRAAVKTYPVIERHGMIWIWMGSERADDTLIPDSFAFADDPSRAHVRGYLHVRANYLLVLDNLMDLSHALYLHADSLATADMRRDYVVDVQVQNSKVCVRMNQHDIAPPAFWRRALGPDIETVDLHDYTEGILPSNVVHDVAYSRVGSPPYSPGGASSRSAHMFTPETATTTHYFYCNSRDYGLQSDDVQQRISTALKAIFGSQDIPMIEAQQASVGERDLLELRPVTLATDRAAMLMRLKINKRITAETLASHPASS